MSDKCEIITSEEPMTYEEAEKRSMEFTRETNREVLFFFEVEAREQKEKHIETIFLGNCDSVSHDYPEATYDGCFHTHPKQDWCRPSYKDIMSSIGYYNIIGCPHEKFKDTFSKFDLRLVDRKMVEDYKEALEYTCKELWEE